MNQFFRVIPFNQVLFTVITIVVAIFTSVTVKFIITSLFQKMKTKVSSQRVIAKTRTVRYLMYNIMDSVILIVVILMLLSSWGVNIAPLLTGAGILGLGISFGSQTLIKDFIAGFFIIIEDQFNIGDTIQIGDSEGKVRMITLRLTVLEDKKGNKIYIPNSSISMVKVVKEEEVIGKK